MPKSKIFLLLFFKKEALPFLVLAVAVLTVHGWKYPNFSGFWAGADQAHYLHAAQAWAAWDLRPELHYYPPAYAMLAAPFVGIIAWQPFMIPDLLCVLASLFLFVRVARRLAPGWPDDWAAWGFVAAILGGRTLFSLWVVPWSSTGAAPLQYGCLLLALRFGEKPVVTRGFFLGFCAGLLAGFRPVDCALMVAVAGCFAVFIMLRARLSPLAWIQLATTGGAGLVLGVLPFALIHLAIFGPHASPYMVKAAGLGMAWALLPLRWVTLVVSPHPLLPEGVGIVQVIPWIIPGIAGMFYCLLPRPGHCVVPAALVAGLLLLHWASYLAFRDTTAYALWRYYGIHYFKWSFPFLLLWGLVFLHGLWRAATQPAGKLSIALAGIAALLLFCWRAELANLRPLAVRECWPYLYLPPGLNNVSQALLVQGRAGALALNEGLFHLRTESADFTTRQDLKLVAYPGGFMVMPLRPVPPGDLTLMVPIEVALALPPHALLAEQHIRFGLPCAIFTQRQACATPNLFAP